MVDRRDHLLPPSATALERAGGAASARIDDIPAEAIVQARDPAQCPAPLLPWLAVHHSVDEWNPAWPEATKRAVIAASYDVKRTKGTRAGVMNALHAQGFANVKYDTWFEYGGSPYRFKLTLNPGLGPFVQADYDRLLRTAFAYKAKRSRLELLAVESDLPPGPLGFAGVPLIDCFVTLEGATGPIELPPARLTLRGGVSISANITLGSP